MIKTTAMLFDELEEYRSPANKISRMVDNGNLIPIVRGLYETNKNVSGYLLASSIYGPSYLSFDFALSYHHLIPEAVYTFTSATFLKKKKKQFQTPFGVYTYQDVPQSAYPVGILIKNEGNYSYLIAEPEKALCDKLYSVPPVVSQKELRDLLFDDLRLDPTKFGNLNKQKLVSYCGLYHATNLKIFIKLLRRMA
ncbi:MAG: type IV toxin-antitoxin system AbiEi family antitoxin domain-containing protein [Bavariicoccus seileri]|uniref:type IV toxin-antitoxin system AbiEi family antitoxin domain-containing protein n=1 Tax=Bavariicoccus seileri TaxID=549685 RepID=UPI003F993A36